MGYWLPFGVALLISLLLTPIAGRLSRRGGMVATPGGRRTHPGPIPKLGGLPLFAAFLVGAGLAYWMLPPPSMEEARLLRGVVLGSVVMVAAGLIDARYELPPRVLFIFQCAGAAVAIYHAVFIQRFNMPGVGEVNIPMDEHLWAALLVYAITTVWIVGMVNTINFLDGLDGLAAGVGLIAALLFAWHGYSLEQTTVAAFPLVLAGALLGFLPFNFSPARIFLGSAGAYFWATGWRRCPSSRRRRSPRHCWCSPCRSSTWPGRSSTERATGKAPFAATGDTCTSGCPTSGCPRAGSCWATMPWRWALGWWRFWPPAPWTS